MFAFTSSQCLYGLYSRVFLSFALIFNFKCKCSLYIDNVSCLEMLLVYRIICFTINSNMNKTILHIIQIKGH